MLFKVIQGQKLEKGECLIDSVPRDVYMWSDNGTTLCGFFDDISICV